MRNPVQKIFLAFIAALCLWSGEAALAAKVKILNVSSDFAKGFYQDYDAVFAAYWKEKTGQTVVINQSYGDSSEQSQSVIKSVDADIGARAHPRRRRRRRDGHVCHYGVGDVLLTYKSSLKWSSRR
jgi:ABC-type sulfate transport system substrate-binding protein